MNLQPPLSPGLNAVPRLSVVHDRFFDRASLKSTGSRSRGCRPTVWAVAATVALGIPGARLQAQEERDSLAGESAATSLAESLEATRYNLHWGPVSFRTRAGLQLEFTDNAYWSEVAPQADLIVRPQVDLGAYWPITRMNTLAVNLGVRYDYYLDNTRLNPEGPLFAPNSEVAFNFFVGDFRFRIRDRFNYDQTLSHQSYIYDAGGEFVGFSNVQRFDRWMNRIGLTADWDLHDMILTGSYDHENYEATSSAYQYLSRVSELFDLRARFNPQAPIRPGFEVAASLDDYTDASISDQTRLSAGPSISATLSPAIGVRAGAGYQGVWFADPPAGEDDTLQTYYAFAEITHRVNPWFRHALTARHFPTRGWNGGNQETTGFRHSTSSTFLKDATIATSLSFNSAEQSYGLYDENYQYFAAGIDLIYDLGKRWEGRVGYWFVKKDSDLRLRDYAQNNLAVQINYTF